MGEERRQRSRTVDVVSPGIFIFDQKHGNLVESFFLYLSINNSLITSKAIHISFRTHIIIYTATHSILLAILLSRILCGIFSVRPFRIAPSCGKACRSMMECIWLSYSLELGMIIRISCFVPWNLSLDANPRNQLLMSNTFFIDRISFGRSLTRHR